MACCASRHSSTRASPSPRGTPACFVNVSSSALTRRTRRQTPPRRSRLHAPSRRTTARYAIWSVAALPSAPSHRAARSQPGTRMHIHAHAPFASGRSCTSCALHGLRLVRHTVGVWCGATRPRRHSNRRVFRRHPSPHGGVAGYAARHSTELMATTLPVGFRHPPLPVGPRHPSPRR